MHTLEITAGAAAVLIWLYLLLMRGWFWREAHRCSTWNNCGKAQTGNEPTVVAIVPARNESATIGRSVMSLLGQKFAGSLRVIVVDDQSDDGTAEAAQAAAAAHICQTQADVGHHQTGGGDRLTVITGKPLPAGWSGKVWAMQQGIEAARPLNPRFLLLTDADVVHAPDNVARLVARAEGGAYDLTSLMVRLHCETIAERLLIPAFVLFFFMLYPPRWIADERKTTAGAAGGCMLLRAEALERAGGMAAICGEVIDDCALARVIKRASMQSIPSAAKAVEGAGLYGAAQAAPLQTRNSRLAQRKVDRGTHGRIWLGLSNDATSVRPYGSFGEIGRMISRSAFNQLRHSTLLLAGALAGMVIAFVMPVVLVVGSPTSAKPGQMWGTLGILTMGLGAVAWSLMSVAYLPMVRFYRLNPLWAATLPAAACFYMGATIHSAVKFWTGRGGEWKGRVQDRR